MNIACGLWICSRCTATREGSADGPPLSGTQSRPALADRRHSRHFPAATAAWTVLAGAVVAGDPVVAGTDGSSAGAAAGPMDTGVAVTRHRRRHLSELRPSDR